MQVREEITDGGRCDGSPVDTTPRTPTMNVRTHKVVEVGLEGWGEEGIWITGVPEWKRAGYPSICP